MLIGHDDNKQVDPLPRLGSAEFSDGRVSGRVGTHVGSPTPAGGGARLPPAALRPSEAWDAQISKARPFLVGGQRGSASLSVESSAQAPADYMEQQQRQRDEHAPAAPPASGKGRVAKDRAHASSVFGATSPVLGHSLDENIYQRAQLNSLYSLGG